MGRSGNVVSSPMAFSSAQHMSHYDISRLVRIQHYALRDMMQTFSRTPGISFAERRTTVNDFVRAASSTVAAEQAVLLPLLRQYPETISPELVDRAFERRRGILRTLEALDSGNPTRPDFDARLERCWVLINAAFLEVDQQLLPALDRHCSWEKRESHGKRFYLYRLLFAPTRPHSWVPAEVGGGFLGGIVNAALAPLDWARDMARYGFAMPV